MLSATKANYDEVTNQLFWGCFVAVVVVDVVLIIAALHIGFSSSYHYCCCCCLCCCSRCWCCCGCWSFCCNSHCSLITVYLVNKSPSDAPKGYCWVCVGWFAESFSYDTQLQLRLRCRCVGVVTISTPETTIVK